MRYRNRPCSVTNHSAVHFGDSNQCDKYRYYCKYLRPVPSRSVSSHSISSISGFMNRIRTLVDYQDQVSQRQSGIELRGWTECREGEWHRVERMNGMAGKGVRVRALLWLDQHSSLVLSCLVSSRIEYRIPVEYRE